MKAPRPLYRWHMAKAAAPNSSAKTAPSQVPRRARGLRHNASYTTQPPMMKARLMPMAADWLKCATRGSMR